MLQHTAYILGSWFPTWGKLPKLGNAAFWFG